MDGRSRAAAAALLAAALASCASVAGGARAPARPDPADPDRRADEAALSAAAAELAPFEDHFVAVAGGRFLGGAMLREDAAGLLDEAGPGLRHAFFFLGGTEGERRVPTPALFGERFAGSALLDALGLRASLDAGARALELRRGAEVAAFALTDGVAAAAFLVEPASGLGARWRLPLVVATGFPGTALVSRDDADGLGLALSEIPGEASLVEALTGRPVPCRRALCRVSFEFPGSEAPPATALVEVLFPR
jgi:hypothetical protein